MEGYTNVIGGPYDFDDLDIEGRVVDEWKAEDEVKKTNVRDIKQLDERTILSESVKLDNGVQADVFSVVKKRDQAWYTCHVCSDTMVGLPLLRQHLDTAKHRANMSRPVHPRAKFIKLDPKENLSLEPGEPVPPGLEEVIIKHCVIQPKIDAYRASPLIGLEFLVELTQSSLDEGLYYHCALCDKNGGERNILIHLTSIFHYMKYLSIFFPRVARKLNSLPNKKVKKSFGLLVTEIVRDIEEKYGRLKPHSETHSNFNAARKNELQTQLQSGAHIREAPDDTFDEKATEENVQKKSKELQLAYPLPTKNEENENIEDAKDTSGSIFNKTNRINVDKKQLRSREEGKLSSSPDVQIIDITLPKAPEIKKRSRSKSLSSISTISSSSSQSRYRSRYHAHSRHHSKLSSGHYRGHRDWSHSRSRSPQLPYRRRRSPSPYSRKYSPGRRSRDRSLSRKWARGRRNSPEGYKYKGTDRYGRSRDKFDNRSDKYQREKEEDHVNSSEERIRWAKFREDLKKIESVKLEKLKYHEKNPEKHPQYPEEWKSFWNRRYNELQRSGIDPSKHDFKPEWISFWTKRMKELYEEDLGVAKDELKRKFDLPEEPSNPPQHERGALWKHQSRKRTNSSAGLDDVSPPTPDKKDVMADIKTTWKAFTGSDIKDGPKRSLSPWEEESKTRDSSPPMRRDRRQSRSGSQSPSPNEKLLEDMPQRKSRTSSLIFVLRKLSVMEQELGSLAPKVFDLLSQSLALEKVKEDASLDLLFEEENCVFLETTREKLIALLCAGIVPRNLVNTARSAIKHIDIALYLSSKRKRSLPTDAVRPTLGLPLSNQNSFLKQYMAQPKSDPVVVPGVGQVDKVAIAQQIAVALIQQGKTNVTEVELEQLINAVVGMAEASVNSAQPMTTANFLHQLQSMQNTAAPNMSTNVLPSTETTAQTLKPSPPSIDHSNTQAVCSPQPQSAFGALKLLQSAYNESVKVDQDSPKPDSLDLSSQTSSISDTELAATLATFNKTHKNDQPGFILNLQSTNPAMYKRLCPFLPSSAPTVPDQPKRTPIIIPISKERSEQKIKPLLSGRLSPFSSRSGGANPTVSDKAINKLEEDDKLDVQFVAETSSKDKVSSQRNQEIAERKINISDGDDDYDDDDDYSFEDVYKAAQEKLRKNQLIEDNKNNKFATNKEMTSSEVRTDKVKDDKSQQNLPTTNNLQKSSNQENDGYSTNENLKRQQQFNDENVPQSSQQTYQTSEKYNTIPSHTSQPNSRQTTGYRETGQREQHPIQIHPNSIQPSFENVPHHYPNKDQQSSGASFSINEENQFSHNSSYSSNNPQSNSYSTSYRQHYHNTISVPYGSQSGSEYGNQMSSYDDQYSYTGPKYGNDNYPQARPPIHPPQAAFPNLPHPPAQTGFPNTPYSQAGYPNPNHPPQAGYSNQPSRYPNPRYPSY